jgi:hypothetical protein
MAGRRRYKASLDLAKDEALRACDFYNQRRLQRNFEAFLVHMGLAWHALLQALNERDGIDLHRAWDLPTALAQRFPDPANPVRLNLEFLVALHARIARSTPKAIGAIELLVAGKAQSCIRNFDQVVVGEFETGESLAGDLRFPVFLSSLTSGADGMPAARARTPRRVLAFIDAFDAALDPTVAQDDQYEFRVLLFQKTGPKTENDPAIEYLSLKAMNAEQRKAMDSALVVVRDKQVPVANLDRLRPGEVVKRIKRARSDHDGRRVLPLRRGARRLRLHAGLGEQAAARAGKRSRRNAGGVAAGSAGRTGQPFQMISLTL